MRLDLGNGQWAELRDRLLYHQAQPIRVVFALIEKGGNAAALADLDLALVRGYVEQWHVLDLDGNAVPLTDPQLAPDGTIQAIALAALDLWKGAQVIPKAGKKHSRTLPRVVQSA